MVERRSRRSSGTELFLNEYEEHFSLITDPDGFTQSFLGTWCLCRFTRLHSGKIYWCIGSIEKKRNLERGMWEVCSRVCLNVCRIWD